MMSYKGYTGDIQFSEDDRCFHGRVINIMDYILFEGTSISELETSFREGVDDYLEHCQNTGKEPNRPLSGLITARIDTETQQQAMRAAKAAGVSFDQWVGQQIKAGLQPSPVRRKSKPRALANA